MTKHPKPRLHARDHLPGGADPMPVQGATLPSFALTGGPWHFSGSDTPLILDDPDSGGINMDSSDTAVFKKSTSGTSAGRAQINAQGFYVIGCQLLVQQNGTLLNDNYADLVLRYEGGIGYSIEVPWLEGFLQPGGGESVPGTRFVYPEGTGSSYDITLQRIHPISILNTTLPVDITPQFNTAYETDIVVRWLGLWGFRVSGPFGSYWSD